MRFYGIWSGTRISISRLRPILAHLPQRSPLSYGMLRTPLAMVGEAPLGTAATAVAVQIMGASKQPLSELRTESRLRSANADTYEFSRADEVKLQALVVCVETKLEPWRLERINKSAQEYLSTA